MNSESHLVAQSCELCCSQQRSSASPRRASRWICSSKARLHWSPAALQVSAMPRRKRCSKEGADVIINSRNKESVDKAAASLKTVNRPGAEERSSGT